MSRSRGHEIKHLEDKGLFKAFCSCNYSSGWVGKSEAQAWEYRHTKLVQQAMAHLRDKSPSVKDQYTYFADKAADPEETPENRRIWQMLADELRPRVPAPKRGPHEDQLALPFEVKYVPKNRRDDP